MVLHDGQAENGGPERETRGRTSLRRCLATGRCLPPEDLLRFVVSPDGLLVPDFARKLPGRGLWLTAEAAIVRQALSKKLFAKAARRQVTAAPDLPEQLARMARERFLAGLGLAKRAGAVVSGYEAVRAAVAQHQVKLLIEASDGADRSARRLLTAAGEAVGCIAGFDAAELGRALGRDIAVHIAVNDARWADRLSQGAALVQALTEGDTASRETAGRLSAVGKTGRI